jgi:hypothetical protein
MPAWVEVAIDAWRADTGTAVICFAIGHDIDHRNESPDPDVGFSLSW